MKIKCNQLKTKKKKKRFKKDKKNKAPLESRSSFKKPPSTPNN